MARYEVLDRRIVEEWGDGEGRAEVQAVRRTDEDSFAVRVCYYQDNGRFGQSAPTLSPDPETVAATVDALDAMSEVARTERRDARMAELDELVAEVGYERAKELLERESRS